MAQPERLTHPNAGIEHQGKQQPVPQMLAGIQDRLNLLNSKDFRQRLRRLQLDRPPPLATRVWTHGAETADTTSPQPGRAQSSAAS